MREIRNEKRMDEYCKKYKIQSHFTDFKKLKKKLVEYKKRRNYRTVWRKAR